MKSYICFFISVAGFLIVASPAGGDLGVLGGFLLLFFVLMFLLGAFFLIFQHTSSFSFGPTLPNKFYFRLPLLYLITVPFLFLGFNPLSLLVSNGVGYLFDFFFNPSRVITPLFFTRINSFASVSFVLAFNLFFWFLTGLLIDKIIQMFRKNNA